MEVVITVINKDRKYHTKSFQKVFNVYFICANPAKIETNSNEGFRVTMFFDEPPAKMEYKKSKVYEGTFDLIIYGDADVADVAEYMATHNYRW